MTALEQLQKNGIRVSALVVNLNSKKIIAKISPDDRLSPASVSKLVIGAQALKTWGSQKTFQSELFMRGNINGNTLNGDLIFFGGGDPYLTNEKLWFLTTDVARLGIKKITGKIIVNKSLFGDIQEDENRKSGHLQSHNAYDAPLSSAAVNFSVLALVVSPAKNSGEFAHVALEPYSIPSVKINNSVTTTATGETKISVSRTTKNGIDTYSVSGSISLHSQIVRVYRSVSNPNQYAGEVMNAFLNHAGVQTSGTIQIENEPLKISDKLLTSVQSFPLQWQLRGLFEMSNNFIADMLTLNLGLENKLSKKTNFLENSAKNLENFIKSMTTNKILSKNPLVLHSGSGLTPENRLSASDVVALLANMYTDSKLFPEFLSALAVPGAEGTLKHRFKTSSQWEKALMLRAKTGTLSEPFDVVSLAGYSRDQKGDWIAFAFITNGSAKNTFSSMENIRESIDSDLTKILLKE